MPQHELGLVLLRAHVLIVGLFPEQLIPFALQLQAQFAQVLCQVAVLGDTEHCLDGLACLFSVHVCGVLFDLQTVKEKELLAFPG